MQSTNLLKKYPVNISLFYSIADNNVFKDKAFIEMTNIVSDKNHSNKYLYSIYTDLNLIKSNIFIPVFDTIYLGCKNHNVVLDSLDNTWLCSMYPHNRYFYIGQSENQNIQSINSILEITNEIQQNV